MAKNVDNFFTTSLGSNKHSQIFSDFSKSKLVVKKIVNKKIHSFFPLNRNRTIQNRGVYFFLSILVTPLAWIDSCEASKRTNDVISTLTSLWDVAHLRINNFSTIYLNYHGMRLGAAISCRGHVRHGSSAAPFTTFFCVFFLRE